MDFMCFQLVIILRFRNLAKRDGAGKSLKEFQFTVHIDKCNARKAKPPCDQSTVLRETPCLTSIVGGRAA